MSHLDEGTLHTYLDGELEPIEEAGLREHLATCAACRARLDAERATRARAHEILRYADPAGIVIPDFAEVSARRAATRAPAATPKASRIRPLILPWAASVVLALGVGWFAQSLLTGDGGQGAARMAIESDAGRTTGSSEPFAAATRETEADEAAARTAAAPTSADPEASAAGAPTTAGDPGEAEPAPAAGAGVRAAERMASAARAGAGPKQEKAAPVESTGAAGRALADREAADAAAVAEQSVEAELGYAAPETIALSAIVVAGAEANESDVRTRGMGYDQREGVSMEARPPSAPPPLSASARPDLDPDAAVSERSWVLADAAAASRELDTTPLILPELSVLSYSVAADRSGFVRVVQRLPGGEPIEIYQRRVAAGAEEIEVILRGAVAADSLARLRELLVR